MTIGEIIAKAARRAAIERKQLAAAVGWVFDEIAYTAIQGDPVLVPKFGVFSRRTRKARRLMNPATRKLMRIPGDERLGFRPSKHQKRRRK